MDRREFLRGVGYGMAGVSLWGCGRGAEYAGHKGGSERPNIVFILADDLGYRELGCYGQKKIRTSNIDRLAAEGMRFTQAYSGSPVCAPSRCTLMTGLHSGHGQVRDNKQVGGADMWKLGATEGGQWPLADGTMTVAKLLQQKGYATGAFGKWGLGRVGTTGDPQRQGFDHFFGYICQRQAHTYYPNHLWQDGKVVRIPENEGGRESVYAHDRITEEALEFIRTNRDRRFFCYVPFTIPHVALQVPEDSLAEYRGRWPDPPYDGSRGYVPHPHPRACYAAMVTRMDRDVGRIMTLLSELGLERDTLVIFSNDNGPTHSGGADSTFFESAGELRGLKGSVYEGGIRVPMIARWPGRIAAGATSDHVCAFWDFLPTMAELIGETAWANGSSSRDGVSEMDGISYLATLQGKTNKQKQHRSLYWELKGQQAVRMGNWKGVRKKPNRKLELYDLKNDVGEQNDVATQHPETVAAIKRLMRTGRSESKVFPLKKKG